MRSIITATYLLGGIWLGGVATGTAWAIAIDKAAVTAEAHKDPRLVLAPVQPIVDEAIEAQRLLDEAEQLADEDAERVLMEDPEYRASMERFRAENVFLTDTESDSDSVESASQRAIRETRERLGIQEFKKYEATIRDGVLSYIKKNPDHAQCIRTLADSHPQAYWYDFAQVLGDYFWSQQQADKADYFYELATERADGNPNAEASRSSMFLALYEAERRQTHPNLGQAFTFLKRILTSSSRASAMYDALGGALPGLRTTYHQVRGALVRRHLSPHGLLSDAYYGHLALLARIYGKETIPTLLGIVAPFKDLLKGEKYDGSCNDRDLVKYLVGLNFWGIANRHVWVHPSGFQVRVKPSQVNPGVTEFTLGWTFFNPLHWDAKGNPLRLRRVRDLPPEAYGFVQECGKRYPDTLLVDVHENEIFKVLLNAYGELPAFLPAFFSQDWLSYWGIAPQSSGAMDEAHYPLKGYVDFSKASRHLTYFS